MEMITRGAHAKYPMPDGVAQEIETLGSRYGLTVIEREGDRLRLKSQICSGRIAQPQQRGGKILGERQSERVFEVNAAHRGVLKQACLPLSCRRLSRLCRWRCWTYSCASTAQSGVLARDYQKEAAAVFYQAGRVQGGSGVIVLPCEPEKQWLTGCNLQVKENTLVLTSSLTSVRQWKRELLDKTTPDAISEYSGESKQTGPVTLATYQILSYRSSSYVSSPFSIV